MRTRSAYDYAVVRVVGKQFDLELPSASELGALSVACNPVEASGFTPWSSGLDSIATAFLRIPIDDRWGVRTDARWINGTGRDAPEHWRIYNGATFGVGKR